MRQVRRWISRGCVLGLLFGLTAVVDAATYYVAPSGSNSHPCTMEQPCQSVAKGASMLASGDTLLLRQGHYGALDSASTCLPSGTSYARATTLASYPGETATFASLNLWPCGGAPTLQYVVFDRLTVDGGGTTKDAVTVGQGAHHVRFQNGEVKNAWNIAFSLFGIGERQFVEVLHTRIHDIHQQGGSGGGYAFYIQSADNLIEGSEMYNLDGYCVQFYNGYTLSNVDRNIVRNNRCHDTGFVRGFGGITVNHGRENQITNNVFYNNFGTLDVVRGAQDTLVANNTLYNNQAWGIRLDIGTSQGVNSIVRENIVYQSGGIEVGNAPGTIVANNWPTDPGFVNAAAGDFRLQAGSPAHAAGATVPVSTAVLPGLPPPGGPPPPVTGPSSPPPVASVPLPVNTPARLSGG